jgi:tetratricopeptide (TPR) repeat protein
MESNGHDDSGEINRLFRFLTRPGPRFGLAIAIFADRVLVAEAREQLREQVRDAGLRVATLELHYDDERHDIVQMMVDASAGSDALFVVGLDRLVTDVFGRTRQTTAIANLNQRRDDLPQLLDARVVFWVAKAAYPSLSDVAWDFCQVMLTTAELEATRNVVIDAIRVETPPEWLQLARADEVPQLQRQAQNLARLYETATDPRAAADAAAIVAELETRLGHMASARTWLERAIAAHERAEQSGEAGRLSRRRAEMALFAGELDDAREHAERARELARRVGNELDAALAQAIIAEIVGRRGDVEAAISTLEIAVLPILVRLRDAAAQAEVLSKIANFREVRGELDEALELRKEQIAPLQQQAAATRGAGYRDVGSAQANVDRIVGLHARKGDLDEAARLTLAAPSTSEGSNFAAIAEAQGNFEAASEIRERAGGAAPPDLVSQARALDGRAARLRSEGELEQALHVRQEQELPIYEQLGDTRGQAVVLGEVADLLTALGRTEEASQVLEEQMLPRADRLGDARLQARASSKALQLRRRHSPAPEAKQAESRTVPAAAAPASAAPARKPSLLVPTHKPVPAGRAADVPASPAAPMSVPISPALPTSTPPTSSPVVISTPPSESSSPSPELEPEASPHVEDSKPSAGEAHDDDDATGAKVADADEPSETWTDRPKVKQRDVSTGSAPTLEPTPMPPPMRAPSGLLVAVVLLVLVAVALLAKILSTPDDGTSLKQGELAACTVVVLDPDDTRSLVRLQAGESDVFDQAKVVCTPEARDLRVVVEVATAATHTFEWPPPAGLECTGSSACLQLNLGCGGTFTCTQRGGEFGCIAGSCRE